MEGCGRKIGPYDCCAIVTGDAKELAPGIPDESVDLIFTDPPYPEKYLHCYSALSFMAVRVLKQGSLCLAYSGQTFIPQVISRLGRHLVYRWTIAVLHGSSQIVWGARAIAGWKPLLVYGRNGTSPSDAIIHDVVMPSHRDKRFHSWGQSDFEARKYITSLTEQGELVYDPFCGGGTVPAVCKMLGRHYLAFEIDPEVAERARERVRNTQPPLFVVEPEQMELKC